MAAFGGTFAGPALSIWYRFLEKNIKATTPLAGIIQDFYRAFREDSLSLLAP